MLVIPLCGTALFFQFFRCFQLVFEEVTKACPLSDDFLFSLHANDSLLAIEEVANIRSVREIAATEVKEACWDAVFIDPSSGGSGQVMALQDISIKERRVAQHGMRDTAKRHSEKEAAIHCSKKLCVGFGDLDSEPLAILVEGVRVDAGKDHQYVVQLCHPWSVTNI